MKTLINILMILFLFTITDGITQEKDREVDVFPDQVSIEHNEAVQRFSRDFVTTLADRREGTQALDNAVNGANQVAIINQFGFGNTASIFQNGFGNFASINLIGLKNEAKIDQRGNDNESRINLIGINNEFSILQDGSNNTFNVDFLGVGLNQDVSQIGNNLSIQTVVSEFRSELNKPDKVPESLSKTIKIYYLLIQLKNHEKSCTLPFTPGFIPLMFKNQP